MSRPIEPIELAKEVWRRDRREKIYDAICWIALGIVVLFATLRWIAQRALPSFVGVVWVFIDSPLPWWIRIPAAIVVVAGSIYLFKKRIRTRIPRNQKFVD